MAISRHETNPFTPSVPDVEDATEVQNYLDAQADVLREQHELRFIEQALVPIEELTSDYATAQYRAGSIGQFHHETYGRIDAIFVEFCEMTGNSDLVVGLIGDSVEYKVTNDFALTDPSLTLGVLPYATPPIEGRFGWVIIAGANTLAVPLKAVDSLARGEQVGWTATGELGKVFYGRVVGVSTRGAAQTGTVAVGTLEIKGSAGNGQAGLDVIDSRLAALETTATDTTAALDSLTTQVSDNETSTVSRFAATNAIVTDNTAAIAEELRIRAGEDAALAQRITSVTSELGDAITAAVATETTARTESDSALAQEVVDLSAEIQTQLDAQGNVLATATSQLTAQVNTNSATAEAISSLSVTINDPVAGVVANASAISALDVRVTTSEGLITANATSITTLTASVTDNATDITTNATAVETLSVEVSQSGSRNLIPHEDWNPELSSTSDGGVQTIDYDLATLGLVAGDIISLSGELKSDGTRTMDVILYAFNGGTELTRTTTTSTQSTAYVYKTIEGFVIPASTTKIRVHANNINATSGTGYMRRFFLTTGPKAVRSSGNDSNNRDWTTARAQWSVEVDANGVVGGVRLIADSGVGSSTFIVDADTFEIWNGSSAEIPFRVAGGVVYIKKAVIEDLSLATPKLEDQAVTTVTSLSGDAAKSVTTTLTDIMGAASFTKDEASSDVLLQLYHEGEMNSTFLVAAEIQLQTDESGSYATLTTLPVVYTFQGWDVADFKQYLHTGAGAGTYNYRVRAKSLIGGVTYGYLECSIIATEIKK